MDNHINLNSASLDIAVIGVACRFPGGASNPKKFWELLHSRKSAYSEVPLSRYNADGFHHQGNEKLNTLSTRGGHFLTEDVAAFDAPFFNITANEAKAMDPTARMLLEVTYEAFENAGLPVEDLVGSDTSCYVGCFTRDYHEMLMRDAETSPMYAGTGTGFSLLSNRISWFYDLRGPSMTLDTACSSSLVGLHLACQSLRTGESRLAVVSGANLILSPDLAMWLSNLRMLSKSGLSKSFSEGANGHGRGEGIATLILRPLADALRNGDTVRAVIRGTGVNQDGHTTGITLPNSDAQADLIRSTYRSAGLSLAQTPYFEAHGTGTAAGDPLELGAVARTLSEERQDGNKLLVGSVKSNIGHLEGAAGLAGVIKSILMLESDMILPNIHFDEPNKRIPFDAWKILVPTSVLPWPGNEMRRISVNSFGYGGTNAHIIIDGAEQYLTERGLRPSQYNSAAKTTNEANSTHIKQERVFVFSAHDEAALDRTRTQYSDHLESVSFSSENHFIGKLDENAYLENLSFTLSNRRSRFNRRAFALASTIKELKDAISAPDFKSFRSADKPHVAFVFTGQGAQWAKMGIELLSYPIFRASLNDAEHYLKNHLGCEWSVLTELGRVEKDTNIQLAKISQPICTILQVALVELLHSWNIIPMGAVGHSSGEIAAAYSYGVISREDAWKVSYWRGKLCSDLAAKAPQLRGAMMAVGLSAEVAQEHILTVTQGRIVVACVNSHSSVTISGDETGIDELFEKLKANSVFCRKLKVENAYHSHHMELIAGKYLDTIAGIRTKNPNLTNGFKMASSVTGKVAKPTDFGPEYWVKNFVSPVLFENAVQSLLQDTTKRRRRVKTVESAFDFVLEIGPHAALKGPLRQILQHQDIQNVTYKSVLLRGENATKTAIDAAGVLYAHGAPVTISKVNNIQSKPKALIDLPSYPWNHSLKYWSESRASKSYRFRKHGRHDLLGAPATDFNKEEPKWRGFLRPSENPWIQDHVVHSSILYPGAGIITMVLEAMQQIADKDKTIDNFEFRDVQIIKAIVIPDDQYGVESILQLRHQQSGTNRIRSGWWEFSVYTCLEDQELEENGFGLVTVRYKSGNKPSSTNENNAPFEALRTYYQKAKMECTNHIEPGDFYKATSAAGLKYGPAFQGLTEIYTGKDSCCVVLVVQDTKQLMPSNIESAHLLHPTTLDTIFHSLFAAIGDGKLDLKAAAVPISFKSLTLSADLPSGAGSKFTGFSTATRNGPREVIANIYMSDSAWEEPKVQIKGLRCRELPGGDSLAFEDNVRAPFGTLLWKPDLDLFDDQLLKKYLNEKVWLHTSEKRVSIPKKRELPNGIKPTRKLEESICKIIDLIAHKNPDLSILQIGLGPDEFTHSLLSILGRNPVSTPRFSNYVLTDIDRKSVEKAEEIFQAWKPRMSFKILDIDVDLKKQGFLDGSFDVIIVITDFRIENHNEESLCKFQALLRPEGKALILESSTTSRSTFGNPQPETKDSLDLTCHLSSYEKALREAKLVPISILKDIDTEKNLEQSTLSIVRILASEGSKENSDIIYVLLPPTLQDSMTDIGDVVVNILSSKGLLAHIVTWPPDPSKLNGKPLISLLELENSMLADISAVNFDLLKKVVLNSSRLLWVSMGDDPIMGAAIGYLRVLKNENLNLLLRYLLVDDRSDRTLAELAGLITRVAAAAGSDNEYAELDGYLCINRWVTDNDISMITANDESVGAIDTMALGECSSRLKFVTGNLEQPESFYFAADVDLSSEITADELEIEVKAISLKSDTTPFHRFLDQSSNYRTYSSSAAMSTLVRNTQDLAKEVSGIVKVVGKSCTRLKVGDRVCCVSSGPYRSVFRTKEIFCQHIPHNITFEEAACWPLTFGTAFRSLFGIAHLQPGQTVLIQAAEGAIGQAAIQLAKINGAIILAMIGSEDHRLLVESYGVPKSHIFSDNGCDLTTVVQRLSREKGVDIILNTTAAGEQLRQLWHCIAPFGHFIDISGKDALNNSALEMLPFQRGASFSVLDMDLIANENPSLLANTLQGLSASLEKHQIKTVKPLKTLPASRVVDAFRLLAEDGNTGKIIVSFSRCDQIPVSPSAGHQLFLNKNATYIIAGGLGGLGRSLARLLVANGARHLVFLSRSGLASSNAQPLKEELVALDVHVRMYACDISNEEAMSRIIAQCAIEMPTIRGLIQSAAALNDSIYDNMTHDQWRAAVEPKIQGSWLLHKLLPRDLDFFVMLSSIAGVVGNRSQANYAAGNTYQDALAYYRHQNGLPAVSVDLGLMLGIGLIAERGGFTNLRQSEAVGIKEHEFHALMRAVIAGSYKHVTIPTQIICGLPTGGILQRQGLDAPFYFNDPRFSMLKKQGVEHSEVVDGAAAEADFLLSQLAHSTSIHEASRLISTALCGKVAKGLQTAAENVDASKPLHAYGVDSLMAVDIRTWILLNIKAEISLFDVLSGISIAALATKIAASSKLVPERLE